MRIEEIKNSDLDVLDMTKIADFIKSEEHKNYFLETSGKEHYRLLSYISLQNDNNKFIDIGTFKGCSAVAMSINPKSLVDSFNLYDEIDLNHKPESINFYIDDVTKPEYQEKILNSNYIFLDTFHDGIFEQEFLDYLESINYKGVLILDDIHYFEPMTRFWHSINKEKYDITNIGHWSGTGLVYFN